MNNLNIEINKTREDETDEMLELQPIPFKICKETSNRESNLMIKQTNYYYRYISESLIF